MIVERIVERAAGGLAISRALDPSLRRRLLARGAHRELPCVRGRTVVPETCSDTIVVGYPNYLGVFDRVESDRAVVLTGAWSRIHPPSDGATVIAVEEPVPESVAADALADARRLAKRLRQLRGVQLAIWPQSPVIVALLPHPPGIRLPAVSGVVALGSDFPEYPGGVRIELPADAAGSGLTRYAATLERRIMEEA